MSRPSVLTCTRVLSLHSSIVISQERTEDATDPAILHRVHWVQHDDMLYLVSKTVELKKIVAVKPKPAVFSLTVRITGDDCFLHPSSLEQDWPILMTHFACTAVKPRENDIEFQRALTNLTTLFHQTSSDGGKDRGVLNKSLSSITVCHFPFLVRFCILVLVLLC
jgi:hypothetical protein